MAIFEHFSAPKHVKMGESDNRSHLHEQYHPYFTIKPIDMIRHAT